ncbi:MAG: hypothetical protein VYD19_00090, partial [Myxococcota bacterium]|nr:hypothetical protein [Myxococcota bacterium]
MLTIFTLSLALLGCEDEAPGREASRISLDMGSAGGEGGNGGGGQPPLQYGIEFTSPLEGAIISQRVIMVSGRIVGGLGALTVNGQPATVNGERFELSLPAEEGRLELIASAMVNTTGESVEARRLVLVDLTPPQIEIIRPMLGAFGSHEQPLEVQGRVEDEGSGVREVSVNGTPVPLAVNGVFSLNLDPRFGLNRVEVRAVDEGGLETTARRGMIAGTFQDFRNELREAIRLKIDERGLQAVSATLAQIAEGELLNLLLDEDVIGSDELQVNDIRVERVAVALRPRAGYIDLSIALHRLEVDFTYNSFAGQINGTVSADPAQLTGKLYV